MKLCKEESISKLEKCTGSLQNSFTGDSRPLGPKNNQKQCSGGSFFCYSFHLPAKGVLKVAKRRQGSIAGHWRPNAAKPFQSSNSSVWLVMTDNDDPSINQTKTKPQVWQRDVSGVAGGDDVQPPVALHRGVAHEPAAVVLRVGEDLAEAAAFGFRLQQEGRGAAGPGVAKGKDLGVAGGQQGFWNKQTGETQVDFVQTKFAYQGKILYNSPKIPQRSPFSWQDFCYAMYYLPDISCK